MEVKDFIKIYDEIFEIEKIAQIVKYANIAKWDEASIGSESTVDFNIRKTYTHALHPTHNSLSNVHWYNFIFNRLKHAVAAYQRDTKIIDLSIEKVDDISILKYDIGGFYKYHTDHFAKIPRTLSFILFLNDDYKGGELKFRNADGTNEYAIQPKGGRLIVWPSNFIYPHKVETVTEGVRYTVVAWAL